LDGLHIVSADIVEVAPAYDTNAELTTMAAADVSRIGYFGVSDDRISFFFSGAF
jgi:agmatinase